MRAKKYTPRYQRGDEIQTTRKCGAELNLVVIEDYGNDLFGASLKECSKTKGLFNLKGRVFSANRELL